MTYILFGGIMKSLKIIVLLLFFPTIIYSQSGWVQLNHGYPESQFEDIFFINENTGFVIGSQVILKTTNAGLNWVNTFSSSDTVTFFSIDSASSNIILAVGYRMFYNIGVAVIYRSIDGG